MIGAFGEFVTDPLAKPLIEEIREQAPNLIKSLEGDATIGQAALRKVGQALKYLERIAHKTNRPAIWQLAGKASETKPNKDAIIDTIIDEYGILEEITGKTINVKSVSKGYQLYPVNKTS